MDFGPDNIDFLSLSLIALASFAAYQFTWLTLRAAIAAFIVALAIFLQFDWNGLSVLGLFFFIGVMVTRFGRNDKIRLGIAEGTNGERGLGNVLGNAGLAAVISLPLWTTWFDDTLLTVLFASSFAAALSDTVSSELGSVFGRKFFNVLSFKKDERGRDGVVSFEGSLAGIAGAALTGIFASYLWGWEYFAAVSIGGVVGNLVDSILGATLERSGLIGNHTVNFLCTLFGALTGGVLFYM